MTNSKLFQLIAGPSREELFDSLRLQDERRKVTFTSQYNDGMEREEPRKVQVCVKGIHVNPEVGPEESWLLHLMEIQSGSFGSLISNYEATFDTKTRKGWIKRV